MYVALASAVLFVAIFFIFCMIYVPVAAFLGTPILVGTITPCVVGWIWLLVITSGLLYAKYRPRILEVFNARQQHKLSLLEQRIKDGKEGICTIVEVV